MKKIYSANDLIEALIVLNLLEHAFIPARLFNQYAQGAAGDIPFVHAYPEVWIIRDEDYERSKRVVQSYEQATAKTSNIYCQQCGEENPANFQLCWKCDAGLE